MQYFLGIDSARGLNVDHDGVFPNVCNVNGMSDCSPYYNSPLLPASTSHVLVNTEVIKQTIFGHEALFRNQVIELHRLYDKQRELMNELKNDFSQKNTQVRLGSSEYGFVEEKQSNVPQTAAHTNRFQLEVQKNVYTNRETRQVDCRTQQCELLDVSRCKKYNNKVLDLQLLATEYMDNEDTTSSIVAEATYPVRYTPPFSTKNDDQQPLALGIHKRGRLAESTSAQPILFDLNELFSFEEATPTTSHEEKPFKDLSRNKTQLVSCSSGCTDKNVQGLVAIYDDVSNHDSLIQLSCDHEPGQNTTVSDPLNQDSHPSSSVISAVYVSSKSRPCNEHLGVDDRVKRSSKKRTSKSRKTQGCLPFSENRTRDNLIRVPKSLQLIPVCNKTDNQSKLFLPPMPSVFDFRRNPIVVQALPCTNAPVVKQKKKSKSFSTAKRTEGINNHLSELQCHNPYTKNCLLSDLVKTSKKGKRRRSNLRASNSVRGSYRMQPPSPENKECAPPRVESDENFSKKRRYSEDDWHTETDVARIAAKALVFFSATDVCINRNSIFEPSLSPENTLHWFAEVVSNVKFPTEGSSASMGSQNDLMFHNLDDFEKMTLKLEDTNKEENYRHSSMGKQDEKLTLLTTVARPATRVRGKRSKRLKDFRVVLPGISSLSKHEVTEDLHLMEGLMEATGTPNIFGSKKRNKCSRGRGQSSNTTLFAAESSSCSLLDPQYHLSNEYHHTNNRKHAMIDWGNITRRRRGQRYPARKLTFIHVAHTLQAH